MKGPYSRKFISGGIALSLLLGGGILYGASNSAFAADGGTQTKPSGQADAAGQSQAKHPGKHGEWAHGGKEMRLYKQAADAIGISTADLKKELESGKSIADVAQAKGVAEDAVLAKLTEQANAKIDADVKAGKLTADKAAQAKQNIADKLKKAVEHKGLIKWEGREGRRGFADPDRIASYLGMTRQDLQTQLKSGKSLADIAKEHNITEDQLIAKIKDDMTPSIKKFVEHKAGQKEQMNTKQSQ